MAYHAPEARVRGANAACGAGFAVAQDLYLECHRVASEGRRELGADGDLRPIAHLVPWLQD